MCVHTIICFKHKVHHYTESEASVIFVNEKENGVKQENNKFVNETKTKTKNMTKTKTKLELKIIGKLKLKNKSNDNHTIP